MNPLQRKKIDVSKMSPEEKKKFEMYGSVPKGQNLLLSRLQKDRKYFDSGDYALSKAGKTAPANVGTAIPQPESIPHHTPSPVSGTPGTPTSPTNGMGTSPPRDNPLKHDSSEMMQEATSQESAAPITTATAPSETLTTTAPTTSTTTTAAPPTTNTQA